ncbi:MAG: sodium:proton antiporter [Prevotellaceae bacterium]|nr:sodium:proton antiporter [Candidatus Minthosoma caballi]
MTLIIVAVILTGLALMSTEQAHHINRAAVAMVCGVIVWVVYLLNGSDFIELMHSNEYATFVAESNTATDSVKYFVAEKIIVKYIGEACSVILFLIATNTIVEVLHNNGVFDSLVDWLRMRNSRVFLWIISLLTFAISANVDNLTTVVLMMSIISQIVRNHHQRVIYACSIMIAASMGGCFTTIGDMTSVMLWVRGAITPSAYAAGLFLPSFIVMCVFNLLISRKLHGRVEIFSIFSRYDGDDSYLAPWQKVILLVLGIAGLWFIPSFHFITKLPPFLGSLFVLAIIWAVEGVFNLERNGNVLLVQRHYFRNTEFIGMRMILYFLGLSLAIGALTECGALDFVGSWLENSVNNVYIYGAVVGVLSSVIDNVPLMMTGMNMFAVDTLANSQSEFVVNGIYWQLLSFCCASGGCLLFVGTMCGQAVLSVERIRFNWYIRHYLWRALVAWIVGMGVFYLSHLPVC